MKTLLTTAAAVALVAASAQAATIIDTGTPVSGGQGDLGADAGQTFTTGVLGAENFLDTISIFGPASGATATVHGLELWSDTDGDFQTWDIDTLLTTASNTGTLDNGATTTFTFGSTLALADNTVYAFRFTDGSGNAIGARWGFTNDGDALSDGALFGGGSQPYGGGYDTAMTITTATAAVPEPSSTALLGLGGLALIMRRRK